MSINNFLERTSVRSFKKHKVSKKDIDTITKVINNSPTSTNAQQFSAVIVLDDKLKDFIGTNNWNQQHIKDSNMFILFIADRSRSKTIAKKLKTPEDDQNYKTNEVMRSVVDATIAATYTQDALIEMGYGVTMVGGVYAFGHALDKKLNLPEESMAVVGLSVGKPKTIEAVKPKMNKVFINKFDKMENKKRITQYNEASKKYFVDERKRDDWLTGMKKASTKDSGMAQAFKKGGQYIADKAKKMGWGVTVLEIFLMISWVTNVPSYCSSEVNTSITKLFFLASSTRWKPSTMNIENLSLYFFLFNLAYWTIFSFCKDVIIFILYRHTKKRTY